MGQTVKVYLNGASQYTAYAGGLEIVVAAVGPDGIQRGAYHEIMSETRQPQKPAEEDEERPPFTPPQSNWDAEHNIDPADRA